MPKEPGYCLHRPSGNAYVNLNGKTHYLGRYGTKESREAYDRLKAEWHSNRCAAKFSKSVTTMAEVCLAYLDHAEEYYRVGTELSNIKMALKPVSEIYANLAADKLGPLEYETIRNWWLKKPSGKKPKRAGDPLPTASRQYVNAQMKRLMRVIKWAVAKGMMPATVHQTLKCIDPLKRGRVNAPECEPVRPVDVATIEATIKHLTDVIADMVRVQLLLGCRPGELCQITPAMIDRSNEVWEICLSDHKTAYRGKERKIYVGPKAQGITAAQCPSGRTRSSMSSYQPSLFDVAPIARKKDPISSQLAADKMIDTGKLAERERVALALKPEYARASGLSKTNSQQRLENTANVLQEWANG